MEHEEKQQEDQQEQPEQKQESHSKYIRMKKFPFIMGIFLLIFVTAGITLLALTFGDEKQVQPISRERQEFEKLYSTYDTLNKDYYTKIDQEKIIDGAIKGMISSLDDPYTDYMDEKQAESFHENISSSFEGIGAEVQQKDNQITIVSPIKGSPAEKAGIKPRDIVLSVNGKSLEGMSANEAVLLIRGKKGTKVNLVIQREGNTQPINVTIVRDTIPIETVYAKMMKDKIARIQVTSFSERTGSELEQSMKEMKAQGMKGMVLDLRQNPGGLLDQAMKIASLFVPKDEIVFQVEYRNGKKEIAKSENTGGKPEFPVVVLVDEGSASASEIVAAALSESADIPLVGVKTYGKGTVQTTEQFKDGSNVKYTMAKWLTPDGNWIHKKGIKPNVEAKLPEYANLPFISPDKALRINSSSEEVKAGEKMLAALGYKPGTVDGYFDQNLQGAVNQFQKDVKLQQTGTIEGKTTMALMDKIREKIQKHDVQLDKAIETVKKDLSK
ncbi:carboxyl-terminal processing protease [Peribacillus deserti]|uniref:Carboxyl-terminal processing protease n=1 Tax=Peribacillus deserti TaxID=673318 RepID=A0ABS2QHD2_9BACI|nr:carboxyl-terminal processing protease [Peribacillus deserti]